MNQYAFNHVINSPDFFIYHRLYNLLLNTEFFIYYLSLDLLISLLPDWSALNIA